MIRKSLDSGNLKLALFIQHASSRFTQHFKLLNGWMPLLRPQTMPSTTLSSFLHFDLTSTEKECRIMGKSNSIFFFFSREASCCEHFRFHSTSFLFYFILLLSFIFVAHRGAHRWSRVVVVLCVYV